MAGLLERLQQPVQVGPWQARGGHGLAHSAFDAPPGSSWVYVAALRRFTGRLLDGLGRRLRGRAATTP